MAIRYIVILSCVMSAPLPAIGQNLDAGDIFNLGNQILKGLQQPQTASPQEAPATPQVLAETRAAPAYDPGQVYETQALLAQLGYDPGPADGVMGNRTSNAIRQFQAAQGLPQTGQANPELLVRLRSIAGSSAAANAGITAPSHGGQAISPSFDCGRATTAVELAICRSPELSELDRALADAYASQRGSASSVRVPGLAAEQKAWLVQRDRCGDSFDCLSKTMTARIAQLGGGTLPADGTGIPAKTETAGTFARTPSAGDGALFVGLPLVDGRPAIFNYFYTKEMANVGNLFELVGMIPGDPRFSGDNLPLWTGDLLGTEELRAIATQAANGVASTRIESLLSNPQAISQMPNVSVSEFVSRMLANDFERQRFATLVGQRLKTVVPAMRPQVPVPIRFYCFLELQLNPETRSPLYDFDTQSFQISGFDDNCAAGFRGMAGREPRPALGAGGRGSFQPAIETGDFPARILLPAERAEEFVNVMAEHRIVIGFDAELDARSGRSKADDSFPDGEPVSLYTIRRTGPYRLYYESQPDRAIYEFAPEQLVSRPLTEEERRAKELADMDRIWYFDNLDEHQALLNLAKPAGSYSSDIFAGEGLLNFGVSPAIESGGWERVTSPDPGIGLNDGFDTRSSLPIAKSLGRPQTSVFAARMNLVGLSGSPISQVYVALPDVLESYKRPAPEASGKLRLRLNFRMKQVWQLPGQGAQPEILIFAVPVSGAYYPAEPEYGAEIVPVSEFRIDGSGAVDYKRFAIARPRDILAAVAQSTGGDRAELIGSLYPPTSQDSFARRDEIEMLASTAEPVDLGGFWMTGNGQYAEYDFETQTFGFDYLNFVYSGDLSRNEGGITRDKLFRLSNVGDDGIRFPLAENEARRLQQAAGGTDATYRALIVAEPPGRTGDETGLPMTARVAEIVVVRHDSDPQVEVEADILARISIAPATAAATELASTAASEEQPGSYDILDIRIRQALDAVLPGIETSFAPESVLFGRREVWSAMQNLQRPITPTTPLAEATILVRNGGADILTIFHEPLLPDNPITGVARTITFAEGARPAPDAVRSLLTEKYGDFATQQGVAFDWFRAAPEPGPVPEGELSTGELIQIETEKQMASANAFRCKQLLSSVTLQFDNEAQSLNRTGNAAFSFKTFPVVDQSGAQLPLPGSNPLWPTGYFQAFDPECGEDIVLAAIEPDTNGLIAALRVLVTNRGYLAETEAKAKQAVVDNNAAGDGATPEIKL